MKGGRAIRLGRRDVLSLLEQGPHDRPVRVLGGVHERSLTATGRDAGQG